MNRNECLYLYRDRVLAHRLGGQLIKREGVPRTGNFELVYQAPDGSIGLNCTANGEEVFRWLMNDAWGWDSLTNKPIECRASGYENPYLFLINAGMGIPGMVVTCHSADMKELRSLNELAEFCTRSLRPIQDEENPDIPEDPIYMLCPERINGGGANSLLSMVPHCRLVTIWRTLGVQALILTIHEKQLMGELESMCSDLGLSIVETENKDDLPVW